MVSAANVFISIESPAETRFYRYGEAKSKYGRFDASQMFNEFFVVRGEGQSPFQNTLLHATTEMFVRPYTTWPEDCVLRDSCVGKLLAADEDAISAKFRMATLLLVSELTVAPGEALDQIDEFRIVGIK